MTKTELINEVAQSFSSMSKKDIEVIIKNTFYVIGKELARGGKVPQTNRIIIACCPVSCKLPKANTSVSSLPKKNRPDNRGGFNFERNQILFEIAQAGNGAAGAATNEK